MKAILLAGGKGTRLRPLTVHTPKPIVPILNRPVLYYQIDLLRQVPEIDEVILSLNYQPRRIEEIFGEGDGLGLKLRYVVLPQALKVAVPPGIGFLVALVKATSLTSVIGYVELTRAGRITSTINQEPIATFLIVGALYFVVCYPISLVGRWYERRLA